MEKILEREQKKEFVELIDKHIENLVCGKMMMLFMGTERCDELIVAHNGGISALMVLRDAVTGEEIGDPQKFLDGLMEKVMEDE